MSLDWKIDQIKDYKKVCWVKDGKDKEGKQLFRLHPATATLIWATMMIGIHEITEKNYKEFFTRISLEERINGGMRSNKDGAVCFTLKEIRQHIGLRTNASTYTTNQFIAKVYRTWTERTGRLIQKELQKAS